MTTHIYANNSIEVTGEELDIYETEIRINNECIIVVENENLEHFKTEFRDLMDRYRI